MLNNIKKYNKGIGALAGGLISIGIVGGILPAQFQSVADAACAGNVDLVNQLAIVVGSVFGAYVAPKNKY